MTNMPPEKKPDYSATPSDYDRGSERIVGALLDPLPPLAEQREKVERSGKKYDEAVARLDAESIFDPRELDELVDV